MKVNLMGVHNGKRQVVWCKSENLHDSRTPCPKPKSLGNSVGALVVESVTFNFLA